jgi:hypothetical protein
VHISKGKHAFGIHDNSKDVLMAKAAKPGGVIALGSCPDRQSKSLFYDVIKTMSLKLLKIRFARKEPDA